MMRNYKIALRSGLSLTVEAVKFEQEEGWIVFFQGVARRPYS